MKFVQIPLVVMFILSWVTNVSASSVFGERPAYEEAKTERGAAVEVQLGSSSQEFKNQLDEGFSEKVRTSGLRFVYFLNEKFALEARIIQFGTAGAAVSTDLNGTPLIYNIDNELSANSLGLRAMLPVADKLSITALVGAANWKASVNRLAIVPLSVSTSGTDTYYGLGVQVSFINNLYWGIDYTLSEFGTINVIDRFDGEYSHTAVYLGYRFQ